MLHQGFRNMEPVQLWSAVLRPRVEVADFRSSVGALAAELGEGFSGFVTRDSGKIDTFTRTRYPRKKYGIPDIEQIAASTNMLVERFGGEVVDETKTRKELFRVVLGLLEGYDEHSELHVIGEVRERLGKTSLRAASAEVFAARPDGTAFGNIYTEPCAVIEGNLKEIGVVYGLADTFRQQRFTVEDFNEKVAWVVETPHCTEPDPE